MSMSMVRHKRHLASQSGQDWCGDVDGREVGIEGV